MKNIDKISMNMEREKNMSEITLNQTPWVLKFLSVS